MFVPYPSQILRNSEINHMQPKNCLFGDEYNNVDEIVLKYEAEQKINMLEN